MISNPNFFSPLASGLDSQSAEVASFSLSRRCLVSCLSFFCLLLVGFFEPPSPAAARRPGFLSPVGHTNARIRMEMYALSGQAECPDQGSPDGPARPIRGAESTAKLVINMVGTTGLEPATSSVSRKRSNQLSYAPAKQYLAVYQDRGGRERWKAARGQHVVPSFTNEEPLFAGNCASRSCHAPSSRHPPETIPNRS